MSVKVGDRRTLIRPDGQRLVCDVVYATPNCVAFDCRDGGQDRRYAMRPDVFERYCAEVVPQRKES